MVSWGVEQIKESEWTLLFVHLSQPCACGMRFRGTMKKREIEPDDDGRPNEEEELKKPVERPAEAEDEDPELGRGE